MPALWTYHIVRHYNFKFIGFLTVALFAMKMIYMSSLNMKLVYLTYFLVAFSTFSCSIKDVVCLDTAVIIGTIQNHDPDDQLLYYTSLSSHPVKIINGQYKIELNLQEPRLISLKYNRMTPWDMYLKPGDSIHVVFDRFDWLNFYTSLQYTGDRVKSNTRLFQLNQLLNKGFLDRGFFRMEESAFSSQLNTLKQKSDHLIASWEKEEEEDKEFIRYVRQLCNYTLAYYACIYPSEIAKATGTQYDPSTGFLSKMMTPSRVDDKYLHLPILSSYLLARLGHHFRLQSPQKASSLSDKLSRQLQLIDSLYTDPFLNEHARFHMLYQEMRRTGMNKALEKSYETFLSVAQNDDYKKILNDWYENSNLIKEGRAPDFSFVNPENRLFKLSHFNSQYVYIDVWATWCGPCLEERPAFEQLMKDHPSITFLSISLDENEERWRNMVKKQDMKGVHLRAEGAFQSSFAKAFQISGIPRFILLGKDRKVIDSNAPRPSDEDINVFFERNYPED